MSDILVWQFGKNIDNHVQNKLERKEEDQER